MRKSINSRVVKFNCFVYVFGLNTDPDFIYFGNTPPQISIDGESISSLIKYNILKPVKIPKIGDYIFYKKDNYFTHAGVMLTKDVVISKLGTEGFIQKHKIEDIFTKYGSEVTYFKKVFPDQVKRFYSS